MTVKVEELKYLLEDISDDMEVRVLFSNDNPLEGYSSNIKTTFVINNNQDLQGFYIQID